MFVFSKRAIYKSRSEDMKKKSGKKKSTTVVHILTMTSESGDNYGPFFFKKLPSADELFAWLLDGLEFECNDLTGPDIDNHDCPGWMGTNLHLHWYDWDGKLEKKAK